MQDTLFHSIIVNQRCNLSCEYCDAKSHPLISHLDGIQDKEQAFVSTVKEFNRFFSAKVLEVIGGGEVFTEKGVSRWIAPVAHFYDHIEIVTNGLNIPFEEVYEVNRIGSFSLAISLDGHTFEMSKSRFAAQNQFEIVLRNVKKVLDSDIYLELRAVLNKNNAAGMLDYLEFLLPYKGKVALQISPVKDKIPNATARQDFDELYIDCLSKIIDNHSRYRDFIAPCEYFTSMREFFRSKKKPTRCYIPYYKMLTLLDGNLTACSVNWVKEMSNLHNMETSDSYFKQEIFQLLGRKRPILATCTHDYGDSDIYNLYMLDIIDLEDLSYFMLYTRPEIKERMKRLKETYH